MGIRNYNPSKETLLSFYCFKLIHLSCPDYAPSLILHPRCGALRVRVVDSVVILPHNFLFNQILSKRSKRQTKHMSGISCVMASILQVNKTELYKSHTVIFVLHKWCWNLKSGSLLIFTHIILISKLILWTEYSNFRIVNIKIL